MQTVAHTTATIVRGILAMFLVVALIGLFFANPFVAGWIGGYRDNAAWQEKGDVIAREDTFRVICPVYRDAGLIRRWVSPFMWENAWCSKYVDRL